MKVAVIGSRTLTVTDSQLAELLPAGTTEIISGGAVGVDTAAELYAAFGAALQLRRFISVIK